MTDKPRHGYAVVTNNKYGWDLGWDGQFYESLEDANEAADEAIAHGWTAWVAELAEV